MPTLLIGLILILVRIKNPIENELLYLLDSFLVGATIVGFSMVVSSFCLFLEEFNIAMRIRSEILDAFDGEVYAKELSRKREVAFGNGKPSKGNNDEIITD